MALKIGRFRLPPHARTVANVRINLILPKLQSLVNIFAAGLLTVSANYNVIISPTINRVNAGGDISTATRCMAAETEVHLHQYYVISDVIP